MNVKIKLLNNKCMPSKKPEDAGYDLRSAKTMTIPSGQKALVPLGIATSFGPEWSADVRGRSGMDSKEYNVRLGLIDSGYRGEWLANIKNNSDKPFHIVEGDRIAQARFVRVEDIIFNEVEELEESDRGQNGFGNSGMQ